MACVASARERLEIVVLVLALLYLLALSWQMTIVALALSPLAIITFKYVGRRIQETTSRMVMNSRRLGGELEETISGIADVQIFDAQPQRSQRFFEASKDAAQNSAWMITWIILDGRDISKVTLATLREQVSKLSQFPFFMKESIRENVRLGRQGASDAEVEEACKTAHIHEVITDPARISRGYETVVDVQVPSGGQKRLIAMARCLLRKPEVLLLDEPTENLDADQRVRLTRIIREYARDRTCMVISHDMDFIAAVSDRI
ncbi:MAG TPA: ABC transporter ATP-binding protein, partial [Chloroflexota bacterium]|nr:ABC transporter ATP-binding protein [Chloroflexota bacterium]